MMKLRAYRGKFNIKKITILFSKVKYTMKNIEKRKTFIKVSQKLGHCNQRIYLFRPMFFVRDYDAQFVF